MFRFLEYSFYLVVLMMTGVFCSVRAENRTVQSFNDNWFFQLKNTTETEQVQLPHTWNTDAYQTNEYARQSAFYKKKFRLSSEQFAGKRLYLKFDAVNSLAEVTVNGQLLATHKGGYTAFVVDITEYVNLDQWNEVKVHVNNENVNIPPLSGDFTIFGGIYRDVWLIATDEVHISTTDHASSGVYVSTPQASREKADVQVRYSVDNDGSRDAAIAVEVCIVDKKGNVVAKETQNYKLKPGKSVSASEMLSIQHPQLWTPDTPNLYSVTVKVTDRSRKQVVDCVEVPLGVRWFALDAERGFLLNGEPLKLMGVSRHQDQYPLGIALTDEMHRRDVKMIKEMGANFLRLAHYPQDEAVLRACDELGLLVWEEVSLVDLIALGDEFAANSQTALVGMIRQHYNHPSVAMWGYMNEVLIQLQYRVKKNRLNVFYENTLRLARVLEETLKTEDPYRLSTMAFHGDQIYNRVGLSNITDVAGWNLYQGWYGNNLNGFERFLDEEHRKYPARSLFVSEFGAGSDRRLQSLKPEIFDFSMQWQQTFLEHYLPVIMERPYVIGGAEWNFIDFSSASRQESMPHINNKGLVYADRTPKDVYYYFQAFLRKDIPVLHAAVSDWSRRTVVSDGSPVVHPLKVYSNFEKVSLFVNGRSYGEKAMENCNAVWNVELQAGRNVVKASGEFLGKASEQVSEIYVDMVPEHLTEENVSGVELAVNVGCNCYFTDDLSGLCWLPDQAYQPGSWGYVGGEVFRKSPGRIGTTAEVKGTHNNPLLQTMRSGIEGYRFDVPDGIYELELQFADLTAPSRRLAYDLGNGDESEQKDANVFDVTVNGTVWLSEFSPSELVGGNRALVKKQFVTVTGGTIDVRFAVRKGHTFLNAIKLHKLD